MSLDLIEQIFREFSKKFSPDYFERFTKLLNEKLMTDKSSIGKIVSSLVSPLSICDKAICEYQFRLVRYGLEKNLEISEFDRTSFFNELFRHPLLLESSILRHLALQIAIFIYSTDRFQLNDEIELEEILQRFSFDPNLYVQRSLAQFLSLYVIKADCSSCLNSIKDKSNDEDLLYRVLILLDEFVQKETIEKLKLYQNLSDTKIQREFFLKTNKFFIDEDPIVFYLMKILSKSVSDYVHHLVSTINGRFKQNLSIRKLVACVKAVFLLIKQTEIEQIDEKQTQS